MSERKTKISRLYDALVTKGKPLTARQIASRFGFANPHDAIHKLRNAGWNIELVERQTANGAKKFYVCT
jgi:hypothetical protein